MACVFDTKKIAVVLGDSPVRLWRLTSAERLERQLQHAGIDVWHDSLEALPADAAVVILRADYLYDSRVIKGLAKAQQVLLEVESGAGKVPVAAHVRADQAGVVGELLRGRGSGNSPSGIVRVTVAQVAQGFDAALLKLDHPFVLPLSEENRGALEQLLFSGAYKGITDLVTKWLWPVPAQWATRVCVAHAGCTQPCHCTQPGARRSCRRAVRPRRVRLGAAGGMDHDLPGHRRRKTGACHGHLEPFGKYPRPRPRSDPSALLVSGLGHRPGCRILPLPPRCRCICCTGSYLPAISAVALCEGAFQLWIASFSIFTWRPVDSYFRLITARRNPNMIMLTVSLALGRPDLGLMAVAGWTALSTAILLLRLLLAVRAKGSPGGVRSWLAEIGQTVDERALAVRAFTTILPDHNKA